MMILIRAEPTFDYYVDCNKDVIMSVICIVDEHIQNSQSKSHSGRDDDKESQKIFSPTFQDDVNCTEIFRVILFTTILTKNLFRTLTQIINCN